MTIQEFVRKNCPIGWATGKNENLNAIYPHFLIDLAAAYDSCGSAGAHRVLAEAQRRMAQSYVEVWHETNITWGLRPRELKEMCGELLEDETLNFGYQRRFKIYEAIDDPNYVIEFIWHRHDGSSKEGGLVDLVVNKVRKELL